MNINEEEGVQRSSDETMDKRENEEEEDGQEALQTCSSLPHTQLE